MPALPLLLISPYSDLTGYTDRINKLSRSRTAEVQWMPYRRDCNELDNFAECDDPRSYLASHPLRRVALISHPRNHNVLGFMSPLLDSGDKFLWVSQFDSITAEELDYFLKGYLSPAAIGPMNYATFMTWLETRHCVFVTRFQNECENPETRKLYGDLSVSEWLVDAGYNDDLHKTFCSHLKVLAPPTPTWEMPPVPPDGRELPLMLLDIEGCLTNNATTSGVPPFVVDKLNLWSRNRTAEIRWMTYWCYYEGMDTFEHGRDVDVEDTDKEVQVLRWIDRNPERQIVWIDSEIHEHLRLFGQKIDGDAVLVDRMVQHRNLLLVQPNAKQGLTADELQTIDTFLAGGMQAKEVLAQNRRVVQGET
eukprot:gene14517-biopygen6594